jgi:predicted O-methyltransferase YrrM
VRTGLKKHIALRRLPPRVAWFYFRARRVAADREDDFSIRSVARPFELGQLIKLAKGKKDVVEIGTGTAWTAIALALADGNRSVATYDPITRPERNRYLDLVPGSVRARIQFLEAGGEGGPKHGGGPAELLFLDSSHERQETLDTFRAWEPALAPGAVIAFHDYGAEAYPGVKQAIDELGLEGEVLGPLFLWRKP